MKTIINHVIARPKIAVTALVVVAVGAIAASGTLAGATSASRKSVSSRLTTRHTAVVASAGSAITAEFPVLSRPATASDQLPAPVAGQGPTHLPEAHAGADDALARQVSSSSAGAVYLIPAGDSVCLLNIAGTQNFCSTAAEVQAGDAQEVIVCAPSVPSDDIEVGGLLPSGASDVASRFPQGIRCLSR